MQVVIDVAAFVVGLLLSIVVHEMAHMKRASLLGKESVLSWEKAKWGLSDWVVRYDSRGLTPSQEQSILLWGPLFGLFPLVFLSFDPFSWWVFPFAFVLYSVGCKHDIKRLLELDKVKNLYE